jgi:thioredoxin-related protein
MYTKNISIFLIILATFLTASSLHAKPPIFLDNHQEAVEVSKKFKQRLLLIFSADWCSYCVKLKNDISKNMDIFEDTTICTVDIDKNPSIAKKYGVKKIPKTVIFDSTGKQIKEITGYFDVKTLGG